MSSHQKPDPTRAESIAEPAGRIPYEAPRIEVIATVEAATLGSQDFSGDAVGFNGSSS